MTDPEPPSAVGAPGRDDGRRPHRHRPATDAEARALASTTRLRILRLCLGEPLTNKEIAGRLGRDPATVLHHVRTLAEHGFLAAQPERRGARGAREVPYLATGLSWDLDWGDRPAPASDLLLRTFLEEVAVVGEQQLQSTRLGLRLSPERMAEFRARLYGLLDEYARAPSDPGGERWSVYLALHPEG